MLNGLLGQDEDRWSLQSIQWKLTSVYQLNRDSFSGNCLRKRRFLTRFLWPWWYTPKLQSGQSSESLKWGGITASSF